MSFYDFMHNIGGTPGDYSYGTTHLVAMGILIALTIILSIVAAKRGQKVTYIILLTLAIFQLVFEVFWRIWYLSLGDPVNTIWPLYPCNLAGILVPLAVVTNNVTLKKMFYLFGFLGGIITFAIPQGIFNVEVLTFGILKSILQHTALILIPVIEYVSGTFRPAIKDFWWLFLGLIIHTINSECISLLIDLPGDYMFFRSDLPFVIPGIPQFITLSVFGLLVIILLNMALDPKGTRELMQKIFHKNKKLAYDTVNTGDTNINTNHNNSGADASANIKNKEQNIDAKSREKELTNNPIDNLNNTEQSDDTPKANKKSPKKTSDTKNDT